MRMYVWDTATPYRDGDIEAGIVVRRSLFALCKLIVRFTSSHTVCPPESPVDPPTRVVSGTEKRVEWVKDGETHSPL